MTVSRRRVVSGAAWAVPAIVVGAAAPAVAASRDFSLSVASVCAASGNSYRITFTVSANPDASVTLEFIFADGVPVTVDPGSFYVSGGTVNGTQVVTIDAGRDLGPQVDLLITYFYEQNGDAEQTQTIRPLVPISVC